MRHATATDIPALLEMGRKFHADAKPEWPWSAEGFADTLDDLIHGGVVFIDGNSFIAGVLAPMPLSPEWIIAHEILWWAEGGQGGRLQRAFRTWAIDQQADEIKWSCRSENERVKRHYSRFAKPCETVYSEILPCASLQLQH